MGNNPTRLFENKELNKLISLSKWVVDREIYDNERDKLRKQKQSMARHSQGPWPKIYQPIEKSGQFLGQGLGNIKRMVYSDQMILSRTPGIDIPKNALFGPRHKRYGHYGRYGKYGRYGRRVRYNPHYKKATIGRTDHIVDWLNRKLDKYRLMILVQQVVFEKNPEIAQMYSREKKRVEELEKNIPLLDALKQSYKMSRSTNELKIKNGQLVKKLHQNMKLAVLSGEWYHKLNMEDLYDYSIAEEVGYLSRPECYKCRLESGKGKYEDDQKEEVSEAKTKEGARSINSVNKSTRTSFNELNSVFEKSLKNTFDNKDNDYKHKTDYDDYDKYLDLDKDSGVGSTIKKLKIYLQKKKNMKKNEKATETEMIKSQKFTNDDDDGDLLTMKEKYRKTYGMKKNFIYGDEDDDDDEDEDEEEEHSHKNKIIEHTDQETLVTT